jgi:hypothetical protein
MRFCEHRGAARFYKSGICRGFCVEIVLDFLAGAVGFLVTGAQRARDAGCGSQLPRGGLPFVRYNGPVKLDYQRRAVDQLRAGAKQTWVGIALWIVIALVMTVVLWLIQGSWTDPKAWL